MKLTLDEVLNEVKSVAIAGHVRPDGDCVGSCMGVYHYIRTYFSDIRVQVYLEPIPEVYQFIKDTQTVREAGENEPVYDLFICLDCGELHRLGDAGIVFTNAKKTLCVDHHMSEHDFADYNYVFPKASSTCELICELVDMEKVTKEMAECLYTGIVDDTGVFQYDSTSSKTMRLAGELMDKGIHFSRLIERTFFEKTYAQNRILAEALLSAKLHDEGRIISTWLSKEKMDRYGVVASDTEGIVEQLRLTKGAEVAVFLHENNDGTYKGSLRATIEINLVNVAKLYGGGGHAKAAGFTAEGDPEKEVIPKLVEAIRKERDEKK